ncbi:MAG: PilZ domain-containing protein [Deltaproteobacteria bacterium]|nr:PilZ domain-containing protein [Deltaproteobacteria bacterium]
MDNIKQAPSLSLPAIPIELGADVLLEILKFNLRIKSMFVGMEFGQYLIVRLSPNDLLGTFRSETIRESPVILRFLYKGVVYGFDTEIQNIVSAPAKIVFLKYPKTIVESKTVTTERRACNIPGMTMFGNEFVDLFVTDISPEGCRAVIKSVREALFSLIQVNKIIEIRMQLPRTHESFALRGKIRNLSKDSDSITIGVQFEEMTGEAKAKLGQFTAALK